MNTLFLLSLIVEAIFGLGFLFIPQQLIGPFGVTLHQTTEWFARLFGTAMISFPVLLFYVRKSDKTDFRKAAVKSMFIYYFTSTVLLLMIQLSGQMNSLGWSVVVLHGAFTVCFGYYLK